MIRKYPFLILPLLAVLTMTLTTSCFRKKVGMTTIEVTDSTRHYYPLVAGEKLNMVFMVKNMGDEILVLKDIQPSCGCIVGNVKVKAVPPHDSIRLAFTYDSNKNVGYVEHRIRLFGNILPKGMAVLTFDVNVVPPANYDPDYEEIYHNVREKEGKLLEDLVNGKSSEKGYYVDPEKDSRSQEKYPWRR